MPGFQPPVHPFHMTVGEGHANQLKFLIAKSRKLFSDPLHGTVKFIDAPADTTLGWNHFADISLVTAQIHQSANAFFERSIAELMSVLMGFFLSLAAEQSGQCFRRQTGRHRLKQTQRKGVTAIWEVLMPPLCESPLVGRSAWPCC